LFSWFVLFCDVVTLLMRFFMLGTIVLSFV